MTEITIANKKYVLVPEKYFKSLLKKAALKTKPEKLLSVEEARPFSKKFMRNWAAQLGPANSKRGQRVYSVITEITFS